MERRRVFRRVLARVVRTSKWSTVAHHYFHRVACGKLQNPVGVLAKRLHQVVDMAVEIRIALAEVFYFADGVNHGGMVFAAEAATDFRE
jgi:hypothetical protein